MLSTQKGHVANGERSIGGTGDPVDPDCAAQIRGVIAQQALEQCIIGTVRDSDHRSPDPFAQPAVGCAIESEWNAVARRAGCGIKRRLTVFDRNDAIIRMHTV